MNSILVKVFAFFIGLFITLIIISFTRINEPFTNLSSSLLTPLTHKIKDGIMKYIDDNIDDIKNKNDDAIIPYKGYKFMCINTYDNIDTISVNDGKWYDIDSTLNYIEYNYNNYFKFNTIINLVKNTLNSKNGVLGANLYNNELLGPSCFNFANNTETYELVEFTMFITCKIIGCSKVNNIIFEMTGNTTTINTTLPQYTTSIINLNLIVNDNKNYDIHLTIGDIIYKGEAINIDKAIIEERDYITIGLFYSKQKIGLILNNKLYEYSNINVHPITLGSTPLIINKYGSINMHLYNFVYYKSLFDFNNYEILGRYNNYYISGLNTSTCQKPEITTISKEPIKYEPINYNKILIPKFKYPILEDDIKDEYKQPNLFDRIFDFF